jgi:serine/threonine protein kinase
MPLTPGSRLHAYEIVGPIGAGGMGEVYKAHDARLGRDVAIKVLPASLAADPASLARFEREARAIGALNHPNIVNVFDTGSEGGIAYVVMELLEGETLRARLQGTAVTTPAATHKTPTPGSVGTKSHGLPKKKALEIAQQIAQGLAAAHARGIVHRDLKPENLLLTTDGRIKILDFGLARSLPEQVQQGANGETRLSPAVADSVPGMVFGTIGYMAPEQVRGQIVDHRADIFAFGAVLYEMLTGERAFEGDSPIETMNAILKTDPLEQPVATVALAGPIEPLVRHCLEKQPDERFQSARDLAFQLQAIASGAQTTSSAERTLGPRSRGRSIVVPILVGIAAFAIGVAADRFLFTSASRDSTIVLSAPLPPGARMAAAPSPAGSGGLAVSRDGRQIAVASSAADSLNQILVRTLDGGAARAVAGTRGGLFPAFSPDGRHLAFWQAGQLRRVPIEGGAAQTIGPMVNPRAAAAWHDDDTLLYHSDYRMALLRVPATGGQASEVLPALGKDHSWFSPVWLPDGRFLIVRFAYGDDAVEGTGVYLVAPGSKNLELLVAGRVAEVAVGTRELFYRKGTDLIAQQFDPKTATLSGQPSVISDRAARIAAAGDTLCYYDPPGGLSQGHRMAMLSRSGAVTTRIGDAGTLRDPRLSPDGKLLSVSRAGEHGTFSIWVYDLARNNIETPVSNATNVGGIWARDGRAVYAGTTDQISRFDRGGNPAGTVIGEPKGYVSLYDITADGRYALGFLLSDNAQLSLFDLTKQGAARSIGGMGGTIAVANSASLSPDGKWVTARISEGVSRLAGHIYAIPLEGSGGKITVTGDQAAQFPRWRGDGRELFYLSLGGPGGTGTNTIFAVPVTWAGGTPDFGTPTALFTITNIVTSNLGFDVTADGQKFVAVLADEPDTSPVTVRIRR